MRSKAPRNPARLLGEAGPLAFLSPQGESTWSEEHFPVCFEVTEVRCLALALRAGLLPRSAGHVAETFPMSLDAFAI